jgi:uncharacterized coiled-coil protein SlyX
VHTNNKQTPRKRQLSDEDSGVEVCKKIRNENENDPPFIDSSTDNVLIRMMSQLSSNLDSMGARLERRISDIESNVEKNLIAKLNTVITERVKGEVNKVKEKVRTKIDNLKENFKRLDKTYAEIVSKEKTIKGGSFSFSFLIFLQTSTPESSSDNCLFRGVCLLFVCTIAFVVIICLSLRDVSMSMFSTGKRGVALSALECKCRHANLLLRETTVIAVF